MESKEITSELRIGNWVQIKKERHKLYTGSYIPKKYQQVENIWMFGINASSGYEGAIECDYSCDHLEGIPLTPELLVKCGFEKNEKYKYAHGDLKFAIYVWDTGLITAETSDCDLCDLEYLHQLQNLYFALTGKELVVDL